MLLNMAKDFLDFFYQFNLMDLQSVFLENDFRNLEGLMEVSDQDLRDMGVQKLGLRKSFLGAVKKVTEEMQSKKSENLSQTCLQFNQKKLHNECDRTAHTSLSLDKPKTGDKIIVSEHSATSVLSSKDTRSQAKPLTPNNGQNMLSQTTTGQHFTKVSSKEGHCTPRRPTESQKRKCLFSCEKTTEKPGSQKLITSMINCSPSLYKHARQKGIRIYSDHEIKKAKGFDKYRLPFLNEISDRLAQDGLSKTEINGAADFEWHLRKSELICEKAKNNSSPSVMRNVDRMKKALKKVTETAKIIEKARKANSLNLADHAELSELPPKLSELRKSQDAAVKALSRTEEKTTADKEDVEYVQLSEEEVEEVVQEVKKLKDVYEFNE